MKDPSGLRFQLPLFCLLLAAMTVFTEWQVYGSDSIRSGLKAAGAAGCSGFHLSENLLAASGRLAARAGLPVVWGPISLRYLQNTLILALALAWWRRLALSPPCRIVGLLLLSWGLLYAFREGRIDTGVFWVVIWSLAGIILLGGRCRRLYPLLVFTGAPWSVFSAGLPLLPLAGGGPGPEGADRPGGRLAAVSLLAWLAGVGVFGGISARPWPAATWGRHPGFDLLLFNLGHSLTAVRLLWLANILPLLALPRLPDWPRRLRRLFPLTLIPALIALTVFFFPEHRVVLLPLAVCLIPGFLLFPESPEVSGFFRQGALRSQRLLIVLLALATLYSQLWILGGVRGRYLKETQLQRHQEVLAGTAASPWRYRILSEVLVEGCRGLGRVAGFAEPGVIFTLFRLLQNLAIFYLAAALYRSWGFPPGPRAVGLVLAGWGMMHAFYNSDLAFSTYTDLIIYLLAARAAARGRWIWFIPLTAAAAFNRETGVLLPALLLPAAFRRGGGRARVIFLAGLGLFFAIFLALRHLWFPGGSFVDSWGAPGWPRLAKNLSNLLAWRNIFLTVNLLPLVGLAAIRRWPSRLREVFLPLIPAWLFLHFYAKACPEETRFLLVPLFLGFVPAVLGFWPGDAGVPDAGGFEA